MPWLCFAKAGFDKDQVYEGAIEEALACAFEEALEDIVMFMRCKRFSALEAAPLLRQSCGEKTTKYGLPTRALFTA